MKRILWISRHPPLPKEVEELERIFGKVQILQYASGVRDADHVIRLIKQYGADEVVTILPLSIIMRLTERGIHPLWPECVQVENGEYDFIDEGSGRKYKFVRFVRVREVKLVTEPL
ncbi:MAG: hypothetical protein QXT64_03735 [Desulfurococcaceae archaeon]